MKHIPAPLFVLGLAGSLLAQARYDLQIIHVNTPGHPTNVVPGTGGLEFNVGSGTSSAFTRPITDSTGLQLAIHAVAEAATSEDEVVILNGSLVVREGFPTPWGGGLANVGFIDEDWGGVNALGDIVFAGDTNAATTEDEHLAVFSSGTWTLLAQEGDSTIGSFAPGILGLQPTSRWGSTLNTARITNTGDLVWLALVLQDLTTGTSHDDIVVNTAGAAVQKSDKGQIPTGQAGGLLYTWETFDTNDVYVSPDGTQLLIQGDLWGPTTGDDVLVLNGAVVLQEDSVVPGSGFAEPIDGSGIVNAWLDRGGNWYARGNNDTTETDWVVRNGTVVAVSDGTQELFAGAGEHWDDATFSDCFFAFDGNSLGHYIIGGTTDAAVDFDGVIVFHDGLGNNFVAAREGDPVDLDGNGLFDDDRFLDTFGNDDVLLLEDGSIVFVANMRTSLGTNVDNGLFRLVPRTASCTSRNGSGINPVACTCVTLPIVGTTWDLDVSFGANTLATFLFADPTPIPAFPLFGGELLIAPTAFPVGTSLTLPRGYTGLEFSLQGMRVDFDGVDISFVLTNAQDAVLGN
jgi:hypothetical protein